VVVVVPAVVVAVAVALTVVVKVVVAVGVAVGVAVAVAVVVIWTRHTLGRCGPGEKENKCHTVNHAAPSFYGSKRNQGRLCRSTPTQRRTEISPW
jgi:hypothetical protein